MRSLPDLPDDLFLVQLLPLLPVKDSLALGATNHQVSNFLGDENFWRMKCKEEFDFPNSQTAQANGWKFLSSWKFIYRGLKNPKVFMWGHATKGRLGNPHVSRDSVPFPVQVDFPRNSAIVDLVAGGWCFHALDSWGRVYVWGAMNGEASDPRSDGFSAAGKVSKVPLRLDLPERVRTLSCGQKHSMALDAKDQIWTFVSWGRPFRLVTPALDCSSSDTTPIQAECGWSYSAALTGSGDVYIWWPWSVAVQQHMVHMDADGDKRAHAMPENTIPCVTWDLHHNPQKLPAIPSLPELPSSSQQSKKDEEGTKIIKIAGMDGFLIALTNRGHVLKFGRFSDETSIQWAHWEYLPNFSETEKVRAHPAFAVGERREDGNPNTLTPPGDARITHITAHFRHFVAYTDEENSIVLRGGINTTTNSEAEVIPELQYKSTISMSLGDYHNLALSADGKLCSWGENLMGALGLRQGRHMQVPTQVRFDYGLEETRERFCVAATASGWHSGALVIDLDPKEEDTEETEAEDLTS